MLNVDKEGKQRIIFSFLAFKVLQRTNLNRVILFVIHIPFLGSGVFMDFLSYVVKYGFHCILILDQNCISLIILQGMKN